MSASGPLPVPPHFNPAKVGEVWRVPYLERAEQAKEWARIYSIRPAVKDKTRVCLVVVDCQNSFCIPGFELFVAGRSGTGAVDDNVRLCEFIYRNLNVITEIHLTMDTHRTMQIFHPLFWVDAQDRNPQPMTIISAADVEEGLWKPNPTLTDGLTGRNYEGLQSYVLYYVRQLEATGKYALIIWPYHAILGGIGHALVSAIEEAVFFHGVARCCQYFCDIKGFDPLTEHYSVLMPEVLTDEKGRAIAEKNLSLIEELAAFDVVVIAGQAKSHCVAWTIDNLLEELRTRDEAAVRRVYLLEDCSSAVVVPGVVDFTDQADAAYKRFAEAGMNVVKSADPIETWPGIQLGE
ncbi:MAG: hypothetical protein LDL33_07630 [Desulfomonile sp.]|nr:hypothetical protein [Desulfomonile sp.]